MTPQIAPIKMQTNHVTIIAALSMQRVLVPSTSGKRNEREFAEMPVTSTRTETGSTVDRLVLELVSPSGIAFALPLTCSHSIPGSHLLVTKTIADRTKLKIEGRLGMTRRPDMSFTRSTRDAERSYRELTVFVERVSLPSAEEEEQFGTRVEVVGTVIEPCRFPIDRSQGRIVTTILGVTGGARGTMVPERADTANVNRVLIMAARALPTFAYLLKRGNTVKVIGELDFAFEDKSDAVARAALEAFNARWEQAFEEAKARNADERSFLSLSRRYHNEKQRLFRSLRFRVNVAVLEPVDAKQERGSLAENVAWRRERNANTARSRAYQQREASRQQQREAGDQLPLDVAREDSMLDASPSIIAEPISIPDDTASPAPVKAIQRRRLRVAPEALDGDSTAPVEVFAAEAPVVEAQPTNAAEDGEHNGNGAAHDLELLAALPVIAKVGDVVE